MDTRTPPSMNYLTWMNPTVSQVAYSTYKAFIACWRPYDKAYENWASSVSTAPTYSYYVGQSFIGLKARSIPNGTMASGLLPVTSYSVMYYNRNPPMVIECANGGNNMTAIVASFPYPGNYTTTPHANGMRSILYYDTHVEVGYVAFTDPKYASQSYQWQFTFPH
jgi:hypothetical protein